MPLPEVSALLRPPATFWQASGLQTPGVSRRLLVLWALIIVHWSLLSAHAVAPRLTNLLPTGAQRGTEVEVELHYEAPGGKAGAAVAKWFGEEPTQQLTDDLRRFKQVLETGEVLRSEGSLEGAGQGARKQRPSQAPAEVQA